MSASMERPEATRAPFFATEVAPGVTVGKLFVMAAALASLFIDQSFGSVYGTIQAYAGGALGASADELSWTTIGYNACYYTVILLSARLIARFGRREVFAIGHASFAAASLYLALTPSLHGFIVARAVEGLAQGTFFVCAVATVLTLFPANLRGYAFAVFSVTSLSGAASGAFIGGWFIDHAYWRGAFALYAGGAVLVAIVIEGLLEAKPGDASMPGDPVGVALAFTAFFGFQYDSAYGERRDWLADGWIAGWGVAGVLAGAAFVAWELARGARAFIKLDLFRIGNLRVGSILGFGLGAPLFGANEFLQYAQSQLGYPPSTAGALLCLRILAIAVVAPVAVLLVSADKIDVKIPVFLGFLLVPGSYALLAVQTTTFSHFWTFGAALVMSGAGFACLFSPIANVTIRSLPPQYTAMGIGIFKMVLLLGGSVAATALGVVYDHDVQAYLSLLAGGATRLQLYGVGRALPAGTYARLVADQAAVLAYADSSKWVALAALVVLPLTFALRKPK